MEYKIWVSGAINVTEVLSSSPDLNGSREITSLVVCSTKETRVGSGKEDGDIIRPTKDE